jgi:hypothetical protein
MIDMDQTPGTCVEETEELLLEAIDMGDIDTLEEDIVPTSPLCTGCSCTCK